MKRLMILISAATALALPGAASGEATTIGNPLDHTQNFALAACPPGCTAFQSAQGTQPGDLPLTAPVNGTVTQWSVRSVQTGATYRLRILRPAGGLSYAFAGSSAISPAVPDAMDVARVYPASVPIQQGDRIGLESISGPGVPLHTGAPAAAGDTLAYFPTATGDGTTHAFTADPMGAREVLLQATIRSCRVPSVVGQAEATATAALSAAECTAAVTKQPLQLRRVKKSLPKKRKAAIRAENARLQAQAGIVLSQSVPPGATLGITGPGVGLSVGEVVPPPPKKKKKKKK